MALGWQVMVNHLVKLCPNGVATIEDRMTIRDTALAIASVGIYTPRTVDIECASSAMAPKFN
ncbi:MAG: hypothetical protein R3A13_03770 [Bdellovibrionota bacterium]